MDAETLQMVIGANIAKYREEKGLTQAKLAELIGVTPVFVSRVERGQKMMKVMTLYTTAKVLQVSCDALLSENREGVPLENIKQLLVGQSDEYVAGIERLIRTCVEEFEERKHSQKD